MSRNDELALLLRFPEPANDVVVDQPIVEVILRLIEDQGRIALKQGQEKDGGTTLTGRKSIQRAKLRARCITNVQGDLDEVVESDRL